MNPAIALISDERSGHLGGSGSQPAPGKPVGGIDDLHRLLATDRIGTRASISILRHADKLELAIVPEQSVPKRRNEP